MDQFPHDREPRLQQFLKLFVWVRERPEDYCSTLGELGTFLRQLYDLCATADGNAQGFTAALAEALAVHFKADVDALLSDEQRIARLAKGDPAARNLIAFWTTLDAPLNFPSPTSF